VTLFSGGLDSLAGAVEALDSGESVALVSHQSSTMIRARQRDLVETLRARTRSNQLFHVSVVVNKGSAPARSFTQRSRSFLFATLGFVVARLFGVGDVR